MPRADATITTTEMRAKFFARAYGVPRPLVLQNRPRFAEPARGTRIRDRLGLGGRAPRRPLPGRPAAGARARGPSGGGAGAAALPPRLHRRRAAARGARGHGRRARASRPSSTSSPRCRSPSSSPGPPRPTSACSRSATPASTTSAPIPTSSSSTPWPGCRWWRATSPRSAGWCARTTSGCSSTRRPRGRWPPPSAGSSPTRSCGRASAGNARRSARALSWEAQEAGLVGLYERVLALSSTRS